MSIDRYLDRTFHKASYNCLHFTRDVWLDITGIDITERLAGLWHLPTKKVRRHNARAFTALPGPTEPCLVLMQSPREAPHIGVYIRGRVLHITTHGVEHMPPDVASRGFKTIRYFTC